MIQGGGWGGACGLKNFYLEANSLKKIEAILKYVPIKL